MNVSVVIETSPGVSESKHYRSILARRGCVITGHSNPPVVFCLHEPCRGSKLQSSPNECERGACGDPRKCSRPKKQPPARSGLGSVARFEPADRRMVDVV